MLPSDINQLKIHQRHYEFLVMSFGLTNVAATIPFWPP